MTEEAAAWLKAYDALDGEVRWEILAELIRQYPRNYGPLTDEELNESAAWLFRMLDEEEENQGRAKRNSRELV